MNGAGSVKKIFQFIHQNVRTIKLIWSFLSFKDSRTKKEIIAFIKMAGLIIQVAQLESSSGLQASFSFY
jgi:hypothetical protein